MYSSWREGEAAEALRVVPVAELGRASPRTVIEDGWYWTFSGDGRAVFFLRGGSRDRGEGPLWAADFPGGTSPGSWPPAWPGSSRWRARGSPSSPSCAASRGCSTSCRIATTPRGGSPWRPTPTPGTRSADARFTYVLQVDDDGERGLIGDNERGTSCRLASGPEAVAYTATTIPNLGVVHWSEPDPLDENGP